MDSQGILVNLLGGLLVRLPLLLIWLAGIIIAVTRWQRHPRKSLMLVLGLATLTLVSLAGLFWEGWLPHGVTRMGASRLGALASAYNIVRALVSAGGWVLVIIAVFSQPSETAAGQMASQQ